MIRQKIVKQLRQKYGTVRKAAESKGIDVYKLRNILRRLDYNKGINQVATPIEESIEWLKTNFDV